MIAKIVATVKPGSKRPGIAIQGETLLLRVRERAVGGAANAACIRLLASALEMAPSLISISRGANARQKCFEIAGIERAAVFNRLALAVKESMTRARC